METKEKIKRNKVSGSAGVTPYVTVIKAGSHTLYADEPLQGGGQDRGPKSHDLVLAGLVSCTCITLRMYLERKPDWKVDEISVDAEMERETINGVLNASINLFISFKGDITAEQNERLLMIAERCPVHKTLSGGAKITISSR